MYRFIERRYGLALGALHLTESDRHRRQLPRPVVRSLVAGGEKMKNPLLGPRGQHGGERIEMHGPPPE